MKKYDLNTDFKRISNITIAILFISGIFILFSLSILLPIYLSSKYYPKIYSFAISIIILIGIIVFIFKKLILIWKKYKNFTSFFLHIIFSPTIILLSIMLLGIEFFIFRIIEYIGSFHTDEFIMRNLFNIEKIVYLVTISINIIYIYFTLVAVIIVVETVIFKIFYNILSFPIATIIVILINIIIIIGIIILRRFIYFIKQYLKEKELK